jgi:Flp pilus assembly pilin Flp
MVFITSSRQMLLALHARVSVTLLDTQRLLARSEGQGLVEYALIVSLVAMIAIGALSFAGTNVRTVLNKVAGDV